MPNIVFNGIENMRHHDYTDMGGISEAFLTTHWSLIEDIKLFKLTDQKDFDDSNYQTKTASFADKHCANNHLFARKLYDYHRQNPQKSAKFFQAR